MFSEAKVTEIYCLADDFCKEFALQQKKYMLEDKNRTSSRTNPTALSDGGNHWLFSACFHTEFSVLQGRFYMII